MKVTRSIQTMDELSGVWKGAYDKKLYPPCDKSVIIHLGRGSYIEINDTEYELDVSLGDFLREILASQGIELILEVERDRNIC